MKNRWDDKTLAKQDKRPKAPVPFDERARRVFLEALQRTGMVGISADAAGVRHQTVYRMTKKNEYFAEMYQEALCAYRDGIEKEAHRRAVDGVKKGVWYRGARVGTEREYSDSLMQTLLKGNRPEKYRDRLDVDARVIAGVMVIATADAQEPEQSDSWADENREVIDVDSED